MHKKGVWRACPRFDTTGLSSRAGRAARRAARPLSGVFAGSFASLRATKVTRIIGLTVGFVLASAMGAHPASAGTYMMWNCNVPGQGNSLLHPWKPSDYPYPNISRVDDCATGGGWGVRLGDSREIRGGQSVGISLQKPTGSRNQIRFVKLVLWYAARLEGSGQPLHFWSGDFRSDGLFHPGLSNVPPGSENLVAEQQLSSDTQAVHMGIKCGPDGVVSPEPCVASHAVPLLIRGMKVTLSEDVPPIVLSPGGTLLTGGPHSGTRTLTFSASDAQSGLKKVDVLLGETLVASHDLTPRCPHSDFTVCPASDDGTLQIDTHAVPNGAHRLTLRVQDAAGNERLVHGDNPVEVANVQIPAAPTSVPAPGAPTPASGHTLSARFNGASRSTMTVAYGRRISVSGRLTHGSHPVAAGSRIEVLERPDRRGAREVRRARVKSKADGSFSVTLTTNRPSRRIRVAYRPVGGSPVVSRTLRVRVRASSILRVSLRGRLVRFSGRVLSGPVPKAGKRVLMEGHAPGSAWTAFKSIRTDRRGRFSGTYRLRVRRPGVRLKIRALVPSERGYGYLSSRSRAVTLRVR